MIRAGVGISTREDAAAAADEAVARALETAGLAEAETALLFATPAYAGGLPDLLGRALRRLGTERVVGATAHGVLAAGREHEGVPAVAVLALSGVQAHGFLLPDLPAEALGEEVALELGSPPGERDLVVLLPDPGSFAARPFVLGLREALGAARVVGAGAMQAAGAPPLVWCGAEVASRGVAGLWLQASAPPRIGVTQSCRPVTDVLTVTRADGIWIREIDGRPALDVYRDVARGPLAEDLARAARFVLAALPRAATGSLAPGGYPVRHVVGFDEAKRSLALPEPTARGQRLAFVLREPESARQDLKEMLGALAAPAPAFGLYFDCCARGASLFGVEDLEAAYLASTFGDAPILGMLGSFELGPVGGALELLTYTGVLSLVDRP